MITFNVSKKTLVVLILLLAFAAISRGCFANNLPLSGDEVGVGVLQATGQALSYQQFLPSGSIPIAEIEKYVDYSPDHGVRDVVRSLQYAGMHPPFYYLLLHYTVRFLSNSTMTLRLISLFFSLLSIALTFWLGKVLCDESLGLLVALFMTISPYCLQYSVMVRPYPLLMFISLFSSLSAYLLATNKKFHFKSIGCYLYILTSVVGLYTMYQYIFVIFFQAALVILLLPKNIKSLFSTGLIYLSIGLLYIPWLPYLKDQLDVVNSANYYFHGQNNLLVIIIQVIYNNFLQIPLPGDSLDPVLSPIKLLLLAIVLFVFFLGCVNALYHKQGRQVFLALLFYLAAHFVGDWMMQSKTLVFEKFQFFLIPMFFLTFGFGFIKIPNRFYAKSAVVLFFSVLLAISFTTVFQAKSNFDGPAIIRSISTEISRNSATKDDQALLIVNTSSRRYLLPLAHSSDESVAVMIMTDADTAEILSQINVNQYDVIFVANLLVQEQARPQFTAQDLEEIAEFLSQKQFINATVLVNDSEGTLTQFTRQK